MYVVMYISDLLCLILQEPNPFSFFQSHQLYTSRAPWQKQWGTHYNGKSVNAHRNIYIYINNENIGNILGCLVVQVHVYNEMQKKQNKTKQNKKKIIWKHSQKLGICGSWVSSWSFWTPCWICPICECPSGGTACPPYGPWSDTCFPGCPAADTGSLLHSSGTARVSLSPYS